MVETLKTKFYIFIESLFNKEPNKEKIKLKLKSNVSKFIKKINKINNKYYTYILLKLSHNFYREILYKNYKINFVFYNLLNTFNYIDSNKLVIIINEIDNYNINYEEICEINNFFVKILMINVINK